MRYQPPWWWILTITPLGLLGLYVAFTQIKTVGDIWLAPVFLIPVYLLAIWYDRDKNRWNKRIKERGLDRIIDRQKWRYCPPDILGKRPRSGSE